MSGGDIFALYRVRGRLLWPSPKTRAQAPPHAYIPQTSLPAHLIEQVQPAEKSQAKSRSPLFLGVTL